MYVTFSGQRGQKVPVSLYKVTSNRTMKPYVTAADESHTASPSTATACFTFPAATTHVHRADALRDRR